MEQQLLYLGHNLTSSWVQFTHQVRLVSRLPPHQLVRELTGASGPSSMSSLSSTCHGTSFQKKKLIFVSANCASHGSGLDPVWIAVNKRLLMVRAAFVLMLNGGGHEHDLSDHEHIDRHHRYTQGCKTYVRFMQPTSLKAWSITTFL